MTAGRLPTNSDMWRIAAPMVLSNISVPLLGMVDTGVTGHLESPAYLGAVAIGGMIFTFLYGAVNFLRMGTTGIAAQSYGAEDNDGLRVSLGQALLTSQAIALAILILQVPIGAIALNLLGGDETTAAHAATYFSIRVWSAPGTLANFALIGWFLGTQNARVPLFIFLTINLTNIVLDLLFVIVLGMKVEGVALASVVAEGWPSAAYSQSPRCDSAKGTGRSRASSTSQRTRPSSRSTRTCSSARWRCCSRSPSSRPRARGSAASSLPRTRCC